jgi:hypothetical protein
LRRRQRRDGCGEMALIARWIRDGDAQPVGLNRWCNAVLALRVDVGSVSELMTAKDPDESERTGGRRAASDPSNVSGHLETCPICGQSFDTRILHQVIYHHQPNHKPIESNG